MDFLGNSEVPIKKFFTSLKYKNITIYKKIEIKQYREIDKFRL